MDMTQITKQFFDFQKAAFNNIYNTMTMVQEQAETFGTGLIAQNPTLPQPAKEAVDGWLKMCKKARDEYKKAVDESFKNLEGYFAGAAKGK